MHQQGILKTDDLITRFFRLCTEMCVDLCYRALGEQTHTSPTLIRAKCFHTLDAFVRLIALLVKHSGDTTNTVTKINLLNKVGRRTGFVPVCVYLFCHTCRTMRITYNLGNKSIKTLNNYSCVPRILNVIIYSDRFYIVSKTLKNS